MKLKKLAPVRRCEDCGRLIPNHRVSCPYCTGDSNAFHRPSVDNYTPIAEKQNNVVISPSESTRFVNSPSESTRLDNSPLDSTRVDTSPTVNPRVNNAPAVNPRVNRAPAVDPRARVNRPRAVYTNVDNSPSQGVLWMIIGILTAALIAFILFVFVWNNNDTSEAESESETEEVQTVKSTKNGWTGRHELTGSFYIGKQSWPVALDLKVQKDGSIEGATYKNISQGVSLNSMDGYYDEDDGKLNLRDRNNTLILELSRDASGKITGIATSGQTTLNVTLHE